MFPNSTVRSMLINFHLSRERNKCKRERGGEGRKIRTNERPCHSIRKWSDKERMSQRNGKGEMNNHRIIFPKRNTAEMVHSVMISTR